MSHQIGNIGASLTLTARHSDCSGLNLNVFSPMRSEFFVKLSISSDARCRIIAGTRARPAQGPWTRKQTMIFPLGQRQHVGGTTAAVGKAVTVAAPLSISWALLHSYLTSRLRSLFLPGQGDSQRLRLPGHWFLCWLRSSFWFGSV
jgi:hypothetical protein